MVDTKYPDIQSTLLKTGKNYPLSNRIIRHLKNLRFCSAALGDDEQKLQKLEKAEQITFCVDLCKSVADKNQTTRNSQPVSHNR